MIESDRARKTGSALARAFGRTAMVLLAALILLPLAACNGEPEVPETEWTPAEGVGDDEVCVRFVDTGGKPVAGAKLGTWADWYDMKNDPPRSFHLVAWEDGEQIFSSRQDLPTSGEDGVLVLRRDDLFHPKWPADRKTGIYAIQEDGKLGALGTVSPADMGSEATIVLAPLQRVNVRVTSSELQALGQPMDRWWAEVRMGKLGWAQLASDKKQSHLLLPPGTYRLEGWSWKSEKASNIVEVAPGKDVEVSFDVPAARPAKLVGKPAPPLKEIDAWIGEPVTLEELKGRVVILHFWGVWCGPLGDLMRFHDEYADRGLSIVTVHNTSVPMSREKIVEQIDKLEKEEWEREFPFPVAIEACERTVISPNSGLAYGPTGASYGVNRWPTTVLIDRNGVVRGVLIWPMPKDIPEKQIRELLAEN